MNREPRPRHIIGAFNDVTYFGTAADLAFNRMHIDLIERHQQSMNEGIARAEALLDAIRLPELQKELN